MRIALKYKSVVVAMLIASALIGLYFVDFFVLNTNAIRQLDAYADGSILGSVLLEFQRSMPIANAVVTALLILLGSFVINKFTIQNNLFGEATKLPSMLYALGCVVSLNHPIIIMPAMAALLVAAAIQQLYASAIHNQNGSSPLAWSCIYLGAIPLLYPAIAPLLLLWVLALLVINNRTYRDVGVAFISLLFPIAIALGVMWILDDNMSISQTMIKFAQSSVADNKHNVVWLSVPTLFCIISLVLSFVGVSRLDQMSMRYSLRRLVKTSNAWLLLSMALIALPSFSLELIAVVAAPVALLLTIAVLYSKRVWISISLFMLLMLCAVGGVVCSALI